jgi:AraC-like DNA-binding protein
MRSVIETGPDEVIYPVAKIATIVEALAAEGIAPAAALKDSRLTPGALPLPRTRVSPNQIIQCCRNAIALSRDPFFAYHAGLRFHVSTQGMYGFALLSSTDYRKAVQFSIKYHRLAAPLAEISFHEENARGIWFIDPVPYPLVDATLYKFLVEFQLGIHVSLHRDVMGASFVPQEIHAKYGPSHSSQKYHDVFGCPVLFEQPENRLMFDVAWLARTAELGNAVTHAVVLSLCDELLDEFQLRAGIAGKVRNALLANLAASTNFAAIARYLTMSPRTLRRRLQENDLSYRKLLDELRMHVAIKYLRDTVMTIEDIADALGFSEAAGFRRAFLRWTRCSPQAFRSGSMRPRTKGGPTR